MLAQWVRSKPKPSIAYLTKRNVPSCAVSVNGSSPACDIISPFRCPGGPPKRRAPPNGHATVRLGRRIDVLAARALCAGARRRRADSLLRRIRAQVIEQAWRCSACKRCAPSKRGWRRKTGRGKAAASEVGTPATLAGARAHRARLCQGSAAPLRALGAAADVLWVPGEDCQWGGAAGGEL